MTVTFSGDGRWLVTGEEPGKEHSTPLGRAPPHPASTAPTLDRRSDLSLNQDGTLLAATPVERGFASGLVIASVPALKVVRTVPRPGGNRGPFHTRRPLVDLRRPRRTRVDLRHAHLETGRPPVGFRGMLTAEISPDARQLATTSADGAARLWDIASRRAIGGDLPDAPGTLVAAGFVDQGRKLAVIHDRGSYVWDVRAATWARHACAVAGRALTRAEWKAALPDRHYAPACTHR